MILQQSSKAHELITISNSSANPDNNQQGSGAHLLGRDEGEELALGLLLVLGRRRGRRPVVLLAAGRRGAAGGEAVLPQLLAHELVVNERRAPEVGEHQPRDEQQLQLIPDWNPGGRQSIERRLVGLFVIEIEALGVESSVRSTPVTSRWATRGPSPWAWWRSRGSSTPATARRPASTGSPSPAPTRTTGTAASRLACNNHSKRVQKLKGSIWSETTARNKARWKSDAKISRTRRGCAGGWGSSRACPSPSYSVLGELSDDPLLLVHSQVLTVGTLAYWCKYCSSRSVRCVSWAELSQMLDLDDDSGKGREGKGRAL